MAKRRLTDAQRHWLQDEMQSWQDLSLLSETQRHGILDLYELPSESAERKQGAAVFILMSVAALLVGLALLLLIGYNWDDMPAPVKLAIIFGIVGGLHAAAFYLRYLRGALLASEICFFLGSIAYGAAIWLVAQIFNINAHYPDGFWWWAIAVVPLALCLDTLLLHTLAVAVLAIWVGSEMIGFPHLGGWFFGRWGFVPNGCYSLPLLALPGLIWAYRKNKPLTVGLYVPLLAWWLVLQPLAWHWGENMVYFIGSVGALLLLVSECHKEGSRFALPYRVFGVLIAFGVLIPLSFYSFYRGIFAPEHRAFLPPLVILGVGGAALALFAAWQSRRDPKNPLAKPSLLVLLQRQWLPFGLLLLMAVMSLWTAAFSDIGLEAANVIPAVLANAAMVGAAYWLMTLGLREDRGVPFAAGVAYFLLWSVLRYIDLFGDFGGMLGAALMFFLCGAALFGVAFYWRRRKELRHV